MDLKQGINGVFKGGGAKGIVYAGALKATEERGIPFQAVAGSSAGAITAALVAAGLSAAELEERTSEALRAVRLRTITGFIPGMEKSIFSVDRLERWLEEQLRAAVEAKRGARPTEPVTFEALHAATHVELNVVAMDLARRQPVVFNHVTSPTCAVATAVVASCAIPVVMPPGRVVMRTEDDREEVHRIVDGGAWANYPVFVFKDESFRRSRGLESVADRPTVGFVIDPPYAQNAREHPVALLRRRRSQYDRGSGATAGMIGALLNWRALRVGTLIAAPVVLAVTLLYWLRAQLRSFFPVVDVLPNVLEPLVVVVVVLLLATLVTVTAGVTILLLRIGRELFDVGLPSAFAALSVGPGVPDWVGFDPNDHVVRLSPPDEIKTTKFTIDEKDRKRAIEKAFVEAARQLDGLGSAASNDVTAPAVVADTSQPDRKNDFWHAFKSNALGPSRLTLGLAVFLGFVFGPLAALDVARDIATGRAREAIQWGLALATGVVALIYVVARKRRARLLNPPRRRSPVSVWTQTIATGVVLAVLTVRLLTIEVGSVTRFDNATRHSATVTRVLGSPNPRYEVTVDAPLPRRLVGGSARSYCGSPRQETCILFESQLTDLERHDRTDVLYIPATSEAFLAGEEWDHFDLGFATMAVGLWLLALVFFVWALDDMRWHRRRQRERS